VAVAVCGLTGCQCPQWPVLFSWPFGSAGVANQWPNVSVSAVAGLCSGHLAISAGASLAQSAGCGNG